MTNRMTKASPKPAVPATLGRHGRALWLKVLKEFELTATELSLLRQACETADLLDRLQTVLAAEPLLEQGSQGRRVHPAAVEIRQQRVVFAKLVAQLDVPASVDDALGVAPAPRRRRSPARLKVVG